MEKLNTAIAVLADHLAAEAAMKKLVEAGFDFNSISVVGRGHRADERDTEFYNAADRITLWGRRGAYWGILWGPFLSGKFIVAPVVVLGFLAGITASAQEGGSVESRHNALATGLYSLGIPGARILIYEGEVISDAFLVMVHSASEEAAYAKTILTNAAAKQVDVYCEVVAREAPERLMALMA